MRRFVSEKSDLSLRFAVLLDASASRRRVNISPGVVGQLEVFTIASRAQPATRLAG